MANGVLRSLTAPPEVNPLNKKARTIPVLNPFNIYGRIFFFSWLGYMVSFLSWCAFPPLMTVTIRKDLNMSESDVANSNIMALLASFLVRALSGRLCDQFGPRWVFIGTMIAGSVPTAMVGLVTNPKGLNAVRFFVGILGATFVPCQVWCTGVFDESIVGSANALAAGWGNAGGGITYFVMPAIFNSLVKNRGLAAHKAWRLAYLVPFGVIVSVAIGMALTCDDTPTGKWSERYKTAAQCQIGKDAEDVVVEGHSGVQDLKSSPASNVSAPTLSESERVDLRFTGTPNVSEAQGQEANLGDVTGEIIVAPTSRKSLDVVLSKESLALAGPYACSFGSQLAINSMLGSYYFIKFPELGQTVSSDWAAMMGFLNLFCRPLGGYISDVVYQKTQSVWAKKFWLIFLGLSFSLILTALGLSDPEDKSTVFGLIAGYAFFMEACNGANFAVVPHVHPYANGIVSGLVGAFGNLGGIIFATIFRSNGENYNQAMWVIGVISIAVNLVVCWIPPVPRGKVGWR
ncbi:uncharacterized protein PADG_02809 [Paracoccidioides brasiliensis Pb18]|uniref:Nitrate/nitrite transporter n=1 Tax=Paracoccidioides brasiliensis (strain Pb18) TaxID=502780 RepID=C1G6K4_PARBD|nr:uncharacterized protein PADG_02809 [Paracoccidioides brasiliensis Pb18]EEH46711.2 hypothetical protein PADG_02809 [Paracoccidioides brasiliensis Pb18]